MYFTLDSLGFHFDTIIVWAFLMGFLINLFYYFSKLRVNVSLIVTAGILFFSYFSSNHFHFLGADYDKNLFYVTIIIYDIVTILMLLLTHKLFSVKPSKAFYYVLIGLTLNSILCTLIHFDLHILENREAWWFWSFYTFSINTIDFLMACMLVVNADFLFILKGYKKIKAVRRVRRIRAFKQHNPQSFVSIGEPHEKVSIITVN